MIINATPHDLSVKRLNIAALSLLICLVGLLTAYFLPTNHSSDNTWTPPPKVLPKTLPVEKVDFHLFDTKLDIPLPEFSQKVRVKKVNTRPDSQADQTVHIEVGDKPFKLKIGEKTQITPLVSMVAELKNGALDLNVCVDVADLEKKSRFHFDDLSNHETIAALEILKSAELIGPDLLVERYGGSAYASEKGKRRLFLKNGQKFFLEVGDLFFYEDGIWMLGIKAKCPLARLEALNGNSAEFKVWNEDGTSSEKLRLTLKAPETMMTRPEQIFTQVRMRTGLKASVKVGNRQMILKKGDWLIKSKLGFHAIQTGKEIRALLDDQSAGELFVFDGWVDGCFKGTLFSSSRTAAFDVKLPLMGKKL